MEIEGEGRGGEERLKGIERRGEGEGRGERGLRGEERSLVGR